MTERSEVIDRLSPPGHGVTEPLVTIGVPAAELSLTGGGPGDHTIEC
jgi:hypothetical protein